RPKRMPLSAVQDWIAALGDIVMSAPTLPELVLYDFAVRPERPELDSYSSYVLKVHRALQWLGLRYRCEGVAPQAIRRYNPVGQLPVLRVDAEPVADSTHILHRLHGLRPGGLVPGLDARAQAEAWLWEDFGDSAIYPLVLAARWADDDNWARLRARVFVSVPRLVRGAIAGQVRRQVLQALRQRDVTRAGKSACWAHLEAMLDHLEARAPVQGYWLGARPSVADLSLYAHIGSLRCPELTPRQHSWVQARSRLSGYLDRVDQATRNQSVLRTDQMPIVDISSLPAA
ncbi:MAG: glutathione S-transferase family protein, partial [Polyangiales bacterium]